MLALVDCNNFFASCECVFNPKLHNRPVVVLSNNDGCVIARSNEAKALGIAMGVPYFQVSRLCQQHKVIILSCNHTLYGDMSQRVMTILQSMVPDMEIYSIDEAFLRLTDPSSAYFTQGCAIRQRILQWTGLPVSVGIAPTKTLAKVANHMAKKKTTLGVFEITDEETRQRVLQQFPVQDIWGVGRQLTIKLQCLGIHTALDLSRMPPMWARKQFNVLMERIVLELNAVPCLDLEEVQPQKQIMASRSFGKKVHDLQEIFEAAACHVDRAFRKLRQQNLSVKKIQIYLITNPFATVQNNTKDDFSKAAVFTFVQPTQDTRLGIDAARRCLQKIFVPGRQYKKVGVMLMDLIGVELQNLDFFAPPPCKKSHALMQLVDHVNKKLGNDKIFFAAQGIERSWKMQSNMRSNCYTTRWDQLLEV